MSDLTPDSFDDEFYPALEAARREVPDADYIVAYMFNGKYRLFQVDTLEGAQIAKEYLRDKDEARRIRRSYLVMPILDVPGVAKRGKVIRRKLPR